MPLGVREVLLVIRAQDQATRVISEIGAGLGGLGTHSGNLGRQLSTIGMGMTAIGTGIAGVGIAGLAFIKSATDSWTDFDKAARLTLTQVDQVGVSLDTIKQISLDVANSIGVPFEQLQPALYDIFSSMDVTVTQAADLLKSFSIEAVAGQVSIQDASKSTIGIMNAFKIPIEDVNHVLDVQFELVKKGRGTFAEFADTIGRAQPSAVRAGQSFETLAGMVAFLTRNNMSAAMASTSSARALDMLSNPKFAKNMQDFGISVFDASGNFRPMLDVVEDLKTKLAGMTPEQVAAKLSELTKGVGGNIQAMRFLSLAVNDTNDLYAELTGNMNNANGAMQDAYAIMAATPEVKIQLLSNRWEEFKLVIADAVIPIMLQLIDVISGVFEWFNGLDPSIKNLIGQFILWGSIVATVMGLIIAFTGIILTFAGVLITSGIVESLAGATVLLFGLPIAIAAVIGAIAALIIYWSDLGISLDNLKTDLIAFKDKIIEIWGIVVAWVKARVDELVAAIEDAWNRNYSRVQTILHRLHDLFIKVFTDIKAWWDANGAKHLREIADAWDKTWSEFLKTIQPYTAAILAIIAGFLTVLRTEWEIVFPVLQYVFERTFGHLMAVVGDTAAIIFGFIRLVADLITGDWGKAWDEAKAIVSNWADSLKNFLQLTYGVVLSILWTIIQNLPGWAIEFGTALWNGGHDAIISLWHSLEETLPTVLSWFVALPGRIHEKVQEIATWMHDDGIAALHGFLNGVVDFWNTKLYPWIKAFPNMILDAMPGVVDWLKDNGWNLIRGLMIGATTALVLVFAFFALLPLIIIGTLIFIAGTLLFEIGKAIIGGLINGAVEQTSFLWHIAWEVAVKIGQAFANAGTWLYDAGAAIVQGLINGIGSLKDQAVSAIKSVVDATKDAVLGPIGYVINSPSKWAHGVGMSVIEGLANGLNAGSDVPALAMANVVDQSKSAVSFGGGGGGGISITVAEGAIVVSGVSDPEAAALMVHDQFQSLLQELISRKN